MKLLHVALSVQDLERSIAWYAHFGFKKSVEWHAEDGSLSIVHLIGESGNIELLWQPDVKAQALPEHAPGDFSVAGLKHLCIETDDIERDISRLKNKGIKPATELTEARSLPNTRLIFFRDPDGNGVELMQLGA